VAPNSLDLFPWPRDRQAPACQQQLAYLITIVVSSFKMADLDKSLDQLTAENRTKRPQRGGRGGRGGGRGGSRGGSRGDGPRRGGPMRSTGQFRAKQPYVRQVEPALASLRNVWFINYYFYRLSATLMTNGLTTSLRVLPARPIVLTTLAVLAPTVIPLLALVDKPKSRSPI